MAESPLNPSDALPYIGPLLAFGGVAQRALSGQPDFCISVDPVQGSVIQGGVISPIIRIISVHKYINKYKYQIRLSSNSDSLELISSFAPDNDLPEYDSIMSIKVNENAHLGDHEILIVGNGADGKEHTCKYSLIVKPNNLKRMSQAPPREAKLIQRDADSIQKPMIIEDSY